MGIKFHVGGDRDFEFDENSDKNLIAFLKRAQDEDARSGASYIMSPGRVADFIKAYKSVKKHFGTDAYTVTEKRGTLSADGWFIYVRGREIIFDDPKEIVDDILSVADNFEVTTNIDGDTEFNIGFYGIVKRVRP